MLGHHSVFKIADTAMVYIPNEEVRETHPGKERPRNYKKGISECV